MGLGDGMERDVSEPDLGDGDEEPSAAECVVPSGAGEELVPDDWVGDASGAGDEVV